MAWADLKRRGQSLLRSLNDARLRKDEQAEAGIQAEIAAVEAALSRAKGKGRRDSVAERNRKAVGNAVEATLADIKSVHQPLWRHLDSSIERGIFLRYTPHEPIHWQL